jgi:hypothetical protein
VVSALGLWKVTLVREEHPSKALLPILVNTFPASKVTEVREEQYWKAPDR